MSENKFIKHLRGENTTGSLVEIQNQNTPASFADMPHGTSNPNVKYSDHRGNATVVAKGTQNWKLSGGSLVLADTVNGNGNDYTGEFNVSGSGLWVNATYTFPSTGDINHPVAAIFNVGTKWVLKLCGHSLVSANDTISLTLLVKIGTTNVMTKVFTLSKKAFQFCEELVIDYAESAQTMIKASGGATLTLQLLSDDPTASATIYNGMTVLTALQRGVDASVVSASFANVEEVMRDGLLPNDFFNNAAFIDQVNDGEESNPVFVRDGDTMQFNGWKNLSSTYVHEQAVAATTWVVNHNLGRHPAGLRVVDSAGTRVDFAAKDINENTCELYFNAAFKGTAYLY